jgi:hypothetical protein
VQRQVPQPGVFGQSDAVLAAHAAAMPQLEVGRLHARAGEGGVVGEGGDPVAVDVGDAQPRAGDVGVSLRTIARFPAGQLARSSRPVASATNARSRI